MKRIPANRRLFLLITLLFLFSGIKTFAQNTVGIGTNTPNQNAVLELVSTGNNQGFLVPRMTTAQRTDPGFEGILTSTDNGLMVFDTDEGAIFFWYEGVWVNSSESGSTTTGGDVSGDISAITVTAIQGQPVSSDVPTIDYVLKWDGSAWVPQPDDGNTYTAGVGIDITGLEITNTGDTDASDDLVTTSIAGGDITGEFAALTVTSIQGNPVEATVPTNGQILKWDGSQWALSNDDDSGSNAAIDVTYDNVTSGLVATELQAAIDELDATVDGLSGAGDMLQSVYDIDADNTVDLAEDALTVGGLTVETAVPVGAVFTDEELPATATTGDVLQWDGSNWVPAAPAGGGDMLQSTYDIDANNIVDDAETVNGLTVETAVPVGALFTDSQNALAVPYDNVSSGLSGTDVQTAIDEMDGIIDGMGTPSANIITYDNVSSLLSATDVQAAIDEVDVNVDDIHLLTGLPINSQDIGLVSHPVITDNGTLLDAILEAGTEADHLFSATGITIGDTDLGTFSGATITDFNSTKGALQELETALEGIGSFNTDGEIPRADGIGLSSSNLYSDGTNIGIGQATPLSTIHMDLDNHIISEGGDLILADNIYTNVGVPTYTEDGRGVALALSSTGGDMQFFTAAVGTAGNPATLNPILQIQESGGGVNTQWQALDVIVAGDGVNSGDLVLGDADNSATVTFRTPDVATVTTVYTLPDGDGSTGDILSTDGLGGLSWVSSGLSLPYADLNTNAGSLFSITNNGTGPAASFVNAVDATALFVQGNFGFEEGSDRDIFINPTTTGPGAELSLIAGSAGGAGPDNGGNVSIIAGDGVGTGGGGGDIFLSPGLPSGGGLEGYIYAQGPLFIQGDGSFSRPLVFEDGDGTNTIAFVAPDVVSTSATYVWPALDGANGDVLSTDGSGGLSWQPSGAFTTLYEVPAGTGSGLGSSNIFSDGTSVSVGSNQFTLPVDFSVIRDNSTGNTNFVVGTFSTVADEAPGISIMRSGGTESIPADLVSGDRIGNLSFLSRAVGAFANAASIEVFAEESHVSSQGSSMSFRTAANGETDVTERILIDGNGDVNIFNANLGVGVAPLYPLDIFGDANLSGVIHKDGTGVLDFDIVSNNTFAGENAGSGLTTGTDVVFVGADAVTSTATLSNSVVVGSNSSSQNDNSVVVGNLSTVNGDGGVALGQSAAAQNTNAIAIGPSTTVTGTNTTLIGDNVSTATPNAFIVAGTNDKILAINNVSPNGVDHLTVSSSGTSSQMRFSNSTTGYTGTDGFVISVGASAVNLLNRENTRMDFGNNGVTNMSIDATGQVGIGTTTPSGPLDIDFGIGQIFVTGNNNQQFGIFDLINAGTGAAAMRFDGAITMGMDQSDANKFKINMGSTFSGGEDFTITSGGSVGIANTAPTYTFDVAHDNAPASGGIGLRNLAGGEPWNFFVNSGSSDLLVYANGALRGTFANVDGSYTPASDRRLKKNFQSLEPVLSKIQDVKIHRYHFNRQSDDELKNIGVVAQELKEVFPSLVHYQEDQDVYTVNYSGLAPITIKAIQELNAIILSQKNEINDLKASLSEKEVQLDKLENDVSQIKKALGISSELSEK